MSAITIDAEVTAAESLLPPLESQDLAVREGAAS